MKKKNAVNKMGFTLLELLIVILIIGLLSAISIPMYKKAVEKSKVADALSTMQAVSKSEHGWYLVKNNYTKDFANLDIDLYDKDGNKAEDEILQGINYTYELLDTGILATRTNGEYSIYQDYDTKQIMCTPGTHFICDNLGAFTKEPCEKLNMAWANTNSTCYANEEARCKGLYDDETWKGDFCGYTDTSSTTLNEGMKCEGSYWGQSTCSYSIINNGGVCEAFGRMGNSQCSSSTINNGGVCIAKQAGGGCFYSTVNAGGVCKADGQAQCKYLTVNEGGVCDSTGGGSNGACAHSLYNGGTCKGGGINDCNGSTFTAGGICMGYYDSCKGVTLYNGAKCTGTGGCEGAIVNEGGICSGKCWAVVVNNGGECSGGCTWAKVYSGGVCSGECFNATINNGGICKSSETNYCGTVRVGYNGTGCCEGNYCGNNKPRCECPIDENTGMHKTSC